MSENKIDNPTPQNQNDDKLYGILSYIGILSIIVLYVIKPKSEFAVFHAKQGSNLFIIQAIINVISIVISILFKVLGVTIVGNLVGLIGTFVWVMSILGIIYVANGKMEELPIVGKIKIIK